ncbi:unnamed protein product [Phytophthora lilii]|uniref:Unnamed protein product n=1 Tax=Phytophthora lilii TaxID=2077276 RepID=A0A9W6WMX2_9STRA|nr:unnamed protein product [Phytophthora lilii]
MLVLRVRCVDDGRELLLERHGADEHSVQVAELKELVLQQRRQLRRGGSAAIVADPRDSGLEDSFVLLRGQILADPDVVDLNALSPADFFVFAPDAPEFAVSSSSGSKMQSDDADSATFRLLRSQLVDMGFSAGLAAQALKQSGNNLSDAAALLAEGNVKLLPSDSSVPNEEEEHDFMKLHPSIAPLQELIHDASVTRLRQLAATDSFQALLLLKEKFSSETLIQLNENPVATLRLLSLPVPTSSESLRAVKGKPENDETIMNIENEEFRSGESEYAIDRVRTHCGVFFLRLEN